MKAVILAPARDYALSPFAAGCGRWIFVVFAVLAALSAVPPALADAPRVYVALDQTWRFQRGEVDNGAAPQLDDSEWTELRLPHTWNAGDGEDGGGYYRGPGWYRVSFTRPDVDRRARMWLEFDGAALVTDAWVNGMHVGRHEGGYARFRFDITDAVRAGENLLAVRVDNAAATHVAPLGGDFTIFGGLYRPVRLIAVDSLHVDLADYGGPGVTMAARNVSEGAADLEFRVGVANEGPRAQSFSVRTTLTDAEGRRAVEAVSSGRIGGGGRTTISQHARLFRPRLWDGRNDPHLYLLTTEVRDSRGRLVDRVTLQTGVRATAFDPARGFLLNGRPQPLYGVNYQLSGRPGRGVAIHDFEIDQDMAIIEEMGATATRFAHMQHAQRAYERADQMGIAVWTEVPLVAAARPSAAFADNLVQQMRELIRQNQHHPSVVVWGLGNEVYAADDAANAAIAMMQATAKAEDPTRATVYAHCCQDDLDRIAQHADLAAYNRYFGWYDGEMSRIGAWADELRARSRERPFGVSEYGAGASILHQQDPPQRPRPDGPWHPEQYQTAFHETYWRALRERPFLWGNFVWAAFDFASDGRNEGDRPGINDKGLVTYDRAVRKDAWYWYQANWSAAPMAHIVSRRLTERETNTVAVRAYTNLDALSLFVNGAAIGEAQTSDHVAEWINVSLAPGLNRIEVRGRGVRDVVSLAPYGPVGGVNRRRA